MKEGKINIWGLLISFFIITVFWVSHDYFKENPKTGNSQIEGPTEWTDERMEELRKECVLFPSKINKNQPICQYISSFTGQHKIIRRVCENDLTCDYFDIYEGTAHFIMNLKFITDNNGDIIWIDQK